MMIKKTKKKIQYKKKSNTKRNIEAHDDDAYSYIAQKKMYALC